MPIHLSVDKLFFVTFQHRIISKGQVVAIYSCEVNLILHIHEARQFHQESALSFRSSG